MVRRVIVPDPLQEIIVRIMSALNPLSQFATQSVSRYVRFGPGPRGAQALMLMAKTAAVLDRRVNLSIDDIRKAVIPTLRHRLILNFQADADSVNSDDIIEEVRNAK